MAKQLQAYDAETNSDVIFEEDPPGSDRWKRVSSIARGASIHADILVGLGSRKTVAADSTSARVQLSTTGIRGVSVTAMGADVRFALGDAAVTASATSHYLPEGQSRDFKVEPGQYIAAIRAASTDGDLEITELAE